MEGTVGQRVFRIGRIRIGTRWHRKVNRVVKRVARGKVFSRPIGVADSAEVRGSPMQIRQRHGVCRIQRRPGGALAQALGGAEFNDGIAGKVGLPVNHRGMGI